MWAELYGKSRGTARGKGGSMHLNDYEKNFIPTSAIVSTAVPEAVGYAFALKYGGDVHVRCILSPSISVK